MPVIDDVLRRLDAIALEDLDERAALQDRVDNTYIVPEGELEAVVKRLADGHLALDIDGRRAFAYESMYFDTPDVRCFREHVEGRRPRFKLRTRLYADSGDCSFEVKVKDAEDRTVKEQLPYKPEDRERITPEAGRFLADALERMAGLRAPDDLGLRLVTRFTRATLAPREGSARLTCDGELRLVAPDGGCVVPRDSFVVVETKSEGGASPADDLLREAGYEPLSLSKYRVGVALLRDEPDAAGEAGRFFERRSATPV
jgi:VTC domain